MSLDLARVAAALGRSSTRAKPLRGGDICRAWRLDTPAGPVFVKGHARPPEGFFDAEAAGLEALRSAPGGPRVPSVLGVAPTWLALEWLDAVPVSDGGRALGRALAALHRHGTGSHGGAAPNFIGTLGQPNRPWTSWEACLREDRLRPQLTLARDQLGPALAGQAERLLGRLGELVPAHPHAAQLHGDLWGGNWMQTACGPAVFDPAAAKGHREVDLAMMALFGGFPPGTWQAYDDAWPLEPGAEERRPLYQLYPLLVHVNLFGGGYVAQVADVVRRYV